MAFLFGQPPAAGLLAGSVSLLGGHGTTIAWAPILAAEHGVRNAMEIGLVCATMGLVLGSLCGGPLARFLIARHQLAPARAEPLDVGHALAGPDEPIDYFAFLRSLLGLHVSILLGFALEGAFAALGFKLPLFLCCLMAGIVLTNTLPRVLPGLRWPSRTPAMALIAELALGVFLALSLMSMQLWLVAHFAATLAVALALQVVVLLAYAVFVMFPLLGGRYDAAVICAGFGGFGLGATPTAMANMTAVTQRYGASHTAFLVVPLVGAFFLDLINAVVIRLFLSFV
jgi:ESS family glutamate:Na+ symporter